MRSLSKILKNTDIKLDSSYQMQKIAKKEIQQEEKKVSDQPETVKKKTDYVTQAKVDAYKIVAEAREVAQNIKISTVSRMKIDMEAAQLQGYEEGLKIGRAEAYQENLTVLDELHSLIKSIDEQREAYIKSNEENIKNLVIDIARKLINTEISQDSKAFISLYKNAVQDYSNQEWVKISVADSEYELATASADLLQSLVKGAEYIDVVKLPGAPVGTCVVETASGIADASVESQLTRISDSVARAQAAQRYE